jgi:hypothetical protein
MRSASILGGALCRIAVALWMTVWALPPASFAQTSSRVPYTVRYTLLEGSYFVDDCQICGRPTIQLPLRGTFDLVPVQDVGTYIEYAVQNIDFTAGAGTDLERHIAGKGTYVRFQEFALLQNMKLGVEITDGYTNKLAYFTNGTPAVEKPFPLVQVSLGQTNGTLLQTFSMQLLAAPIREIWFSISKGFTSTNRFAPTNQISAGDLISIRGRVVKRNLDLAGRLGVMPIVSDLGLDAVHVTRKAEILFSIPINVFSETLGPIHHGDLLSSRGAVVKRNQELLAAFHPVASADAGLDAIQVMPDGEILFSTRSNLVQSSGITLGRGDILSDRGRIFLTHQQLLTNFQPAITNRDFGLDALRILPSGEIWFSVEEDFNDSRLGTVRHGDLLSSMGYRVFSNRDLLAGFAPADSAQDYGLDALFVVTDTQSARAAPRIVRQIRTNNLLRIEWDGEGDVFQVETAPGLSGPWHACTDILADLAGEVSPALNAGCGLYRVRQW